MQTPSSLAILLCLCLGQSHGLLLRPPVFEKPKSAARAAVHFDTQRLKSAGLAALASVALIASPLPAHAKGGGHGGGGHSSSHSSSHRSSHSSSRPSYPKSSSLSYRSSSSKRSGSRHSSSQSSSRPSYPKSSSLSYRSSSSKRSGSRSRRSSGLASRTGSPSYSSDRNLRIFPSDAEARNGGGLVCPASLPEVGSKVDVAGVGTATILERQPALQSGLYPTTRGTLASPLPAGFDAGCTLTVQYKDGTTDTISASQEPKSELEEAFDAYLVPASLLAYGGLAVSSSFADSKFKEMDKILSDVEDATDVIDGSTREALRALSGEYWGGSEGESDGGDQSVRVTFDFKGNGQITGRGRDGEDGPYTIKRGRWVKEDSGRLWVAWEERYSEGFRTICIGHIDPKTSKVKANFASSRSVSGGFKLVKKPSVF